MRFLCKCGVTLSNAEVPNNVEMSVFTDREWDEIINSGLIDAGDLPSPKFFVWRCPNCERIYVFDGNKLIKYYTLSNIDELTEQ